MKPEYHAARAYRLTQVKTSNGFDLMLICYDAAVRGCRNQDRDLVVGALGSLAQSLNYRADPEQAESLAALYEYCARLADQGRFRRAGEIISEIRAVWKQVRPLGGRLPRTA